MRLLSTLVLALLLMFTPVAGTAQEATPEANYNPDELLAIKPELQADVAANLPAGLTEYEIDLTYYKDDFDTGFHLDGAVSVKYTNTTGETLDAIPFRLYANSPDQPETLTISDISVDGQGAEGQLSVDNSVFTLPMDRTLAPGDQTRIQIDFTINVPIDDPAHYGILNYSTENSTTVMAHWYPMVAGRDPNTGWMLKPVSQFGDPVFSDAGMYDVTITSPADSMFITSGVESKREELSDGWVETTYTAKPSRDFVIIESSELEAVTVEQDGTSISSWHMPNHEADGEAVAEWTANSLAIFNPLLGEYPWLQLNVVEAEVFGAAAVELPQMFIMGSTFYGSSNLSELPSYFEFTVAHEAVHMWFYSLVGNNQYDDAFIDEGLTNYLSGDVYFRLQYDDEVGDAAFNQFLNRPFERMIESGADVIVDHPTDDFPNGNSYVSAVYTKAPLGFRAIHLEIGDDAFFGGLNDYVQEFSFRVATPADLQAALQARTDVDVAEIWSHWFKRREGQLDIQGVARTWHA